MGDLQEAMMAGEEPVGELPERARPRADAVSRRAPRLREPRRDQIELQAVDIESLIGEDHAVRVIWAYVEGLDLSELEDQIKARSTGPVIRRRRRGFCWRCGSMPAAMASAARALWSGCA